MIPTGKEKAVCKLLIPPYLLRKAFGWPDRADIGFYGTGQYDFEDSNLDCYKIHDYKQTDLYHGEAREPEFYTTAKNLKKPLSRRKKMWPTYEEFWKSEEPKEFRLMAGEQADWKRFKRWLRKHLQSIEGTDYDYDTECMAKHGDVMDICIGDYDKKDPVNTSMAVFNWTNKIYMTPEEYAGLADDKKPV